MLDEKGYKKCTYGAMYLCLFVIYQHIFIKQLPFQNDTSPSDEAHDKSTPSSSRCVSRTGQSNIQANETNDVRAHIHCYLFLLFLCNIYHQTINPKK